MAKENFILMDINWIGAESGIEKVEEAT